MVSFIVATALLGGSLSYGQIVVQHSGANDPVAEGFSFGSFRDPDVGPVIDDSARDAWSIRDVHPFGYSCYQYELLPKEEGGANAHGWTLSAEMRFVEPGVARLEFQTTMEYFPLWIVLDGTGDIMLTRDQTPLYTIVGGGTDYHEYSLVYDPFEATVALWVNGSIRITDFPAFDRLSSQGLISFGNAGAGSHTHWNDFNFAIVPEPATVALVAGIGALLLVGGVRWRRRKGRRNRRLR